MLPNQLKKFEELKLKGTHCVPSLSLPPTKKHVSLVGFMGVGKTTICNALDSIGLDLDFLIEKEAMLKICDIFKNYGETYFRDLELNTLKSVSKMTQPICLATGGGIITQEEARDELKKNYYNIFLYLPLEIVIERVNADKKRPLFSPDLEQLQQLFLSRLDWYLDVADIAMDTQEFSTEEVVELILHLLKAKRD